MKITKFVHSCLLVETPDRTAIFDPGVMSAEALGAAIPVLGRLDDIFITHVHQDHCDPALIKQLLAKFPNIRITAPADAVAALATENIKASDQPPQGVTFFDSPHEDVAPLFGQPPQELGFHYLDTLSDPGDSHSFTETKAILALPVQAPWGSTIRALNLALELKPKHVLPIHDWHWSDVAREQSYGMFERILGEQGIMFHKLQTGQPVDITV
jgi:L-ascorbate metabolism protein UlaG (beta-lactamase superfamily)